ncbi:MAG: hypothetical protein AAB437_04295 [Patescibacteria group bacterium]
MAIQRQIEAAAQSFSRTASILREASSGLLSSKQLLTFLGIAATVILPGCAPKTETPIPLTSTPFPSGETPTPTVEPQKPDELKTLKTLTSLFEAGMDNLGYNSITSAEKPEDPLVAKAQESIKSLISGLNGVDPDQNFDISFFSGQDQDGKDITVGTASSDQFVFLLTSDGKEVTALPVFDLGLSGGKRQFSPLFPTNEPGVFASQPFIEIAGEDGNQSIKFTYPNHKHTLSGIIMDGTQTSFDNFVLYETISSNPALGTVDYDPSSNHWLIRGEDGGIAVLSFDIYGNLQKTETSGLSWWDTKTDDWIKIDILDANSLPPQAQEYVNTLTTRPAAETESELERKYDEEDKNFHIFQSRYLINKMSENPEFLAKYGINIEALNQLSDADLENYDTYFSQIFLPTLIMNYENYQATGKYESLPFDQWMVEQMYKIENCVPSRNVDGKITYGFQFDSPLTRSSVIEWRKVITEAIKENSSLEFKTIINGHSIDSQRIRFQGKAKFINLGLTELPGYPNVKIIIGGAFDENGKLVVQPFVVNTDRTLLPDGRILLPTSTRFVRSIQDERDNYDEISWDLDELINTIGNVIIITPDDVFVQFEDISVPVEQATLEKLIVKTVGGIELVGKMSTEGPSLEFQDLLPQSEIVPTAPVTVTPPASPTPKP